MEIKNASVQSRSLNKLYNVFANPSRQVKCEVAHEFVPRPL